MEQIRGQEFVYEFSISDLPGILVETWVRGGRQVYRYTTSGVMWSEDLDAGAAVVGSIVEQERVVGESLRRRAL